MTHPAPTPTQAILVVEDDDLLRGLLAIVLREEGFTVQICPDGRVAMQTLEAAKASGTLPRMIILDLNMPLVNGWEVAAWLDADPVLGRIPLVVTSATQAHGEEAKKLHADAYLVKPYDTDEILGIVELIALMP